MAINAPVLGRAVFGTTSGLKAYGNGVLAGVGNTVSVLEFGGGDSGHIHRMAPDQAAVFFRRAENQDGNVIELVGTVAPCRDSGRRQGFLGACVAVTPDGGQSFSDWPALYSEIEHLFEQMRARVDSTSGVFRMYRPDPPPSEMDDYAFNWSALSGETLILHDTDTLDPAGMMERLQAIAFAHGSDYPDVLVFEAPVPESLGLDCPEVDEALQKFNKARAEAEAKAKSKRAAPPVQTATDRDRDIAHLVAEISELRSDLRHAVETLQLESHRLRTVLNTNTEQTDEDELLPFGKIAAIAASFVVFLSIICVIILFFASGDGSDTQTQSPEPSGPAAGGSAGEQTTEHTTGQ